MKLYIMFLYRCFEFGRKGVTALKEKEFNDLTIMLLPLSLIRSEN